MVVEAVPSAAVLAVAVDHVRLSYLYLDGGDLDGYGSLLHADAQFRRPDAADARGRAEVLEMLAARRVVGAHELFKVVADGDCVAAVGRHAGVDGVGVEFADFFTIGDDGLILGCRRFYYLSP
ncbi:nuclear transport factor 2 family protein [Actinokineospora pegani]|uniref:nuclear transport factor 2 family protein n=1 Tax=Actinokineospora pegani TaxID=2654637 RepID=UPI0012EAA4E7|nr:nuclear transport factor 2 family protein [Actinokineospora pegani]